MLSVTVVTKAMGKKGNMKSGCVDALLFFCFCLPRRNPACVSSVPFCCGYAEMSKDHSWRSIALTEKPESISTEVHFHCRNKFRSTLFLSSKRTSSSSSFFLFLGDGGGWYVSPALGSYFIFWVKDVFVRRDPP